MTAKFSILGDDDPFLHVSLDQGDKIYCESDGMVMMEANLELRGRMQGGFGRSLMRRLAGGDSFFQEHIEATRGGGDCLLAPQLPGGIEILEVDGTHRYTISDGAFLAASDSVVLNTRMQGLGSALFGQTGGFLVMEAQGQGKLIVAGFGSLFTLDVNPGKDVIIDNGHVIAWDSNLRSEITIATGGNSGLLGRLVNSVTSGEGMVLKFSGQGKVVVCSRNQTGLVTWLHKMLGGAKDQSTSSGLGGLLGRHALARPTAWKAARSVAPFGCGSSLLSAHLSGSLACPSPSRKARRSRSTRRPARR